MVIADLRGWCTATRVYCRSSCNNLECNESSCHTNLSYNQDSNAFTLYDATCSGSGYFTCTGRFSLQFTWAPLRHNLQTTQTRNKKVLKAMIVMTFKEKNNNISRPNRFIGNRWSFKGESSKGSVIDTQGWEEVHCHVKHMTLKRRLLHELTRHLQTHVWWVMHYSNTLLIFFF